MPVTVADNTCFTGWTSNSHLPVAARSLDRGKVGNVPSAIQGAAVAAFTAAALTTAPTGASGAGGKPRENAGAGVLVIGHRGASGYRPEHTLASYELAARMGADFIEPDLVSTSDGVLVARHESAIGDTTDVANRPQFADRRTTKTIDGVEHTGWFTEDFTLAELKTLRAKERIPAIRQENTIYDGRFEIPTFDEVLQLCERLTEELGRVIGVYPETKHPTYFASIGKPLEPALVATLDRAGLNRPDAPVFVQSFETANLRKLNDELHVPLVQLLEAKGIPADLAAAGDPRTYADLATPAGLADIASYADAIGPDKNMVVARNADGTLGAPTPLVGYAHAVNLLVHPYTFRNENHFLPANLRTTGSAVDYGNVFAEYAAFFAAGVDGVFADNPDTAVAAREAQ
ncbi:MAG: glycerophosphoryl diester phosphodiesterase [Pseudonocardiales bacterium]|jgi:glycerophosphoryl diester phosphodiesterase|nr:glpQ1 [Pseudonocardia sp.]MDT7653031.1 glycerophosphoryl diester phosphodiesterase [Pseudonocardiales bacterium]